MSVLVEHWELFASIVVPLLTLSGTIGWAAGSYILRTNEKVLSELALAIEELRNQTKIMCETYQKDMRNIVTKDFCRDESSDCNKKRDIFRFGLEKKIDELRADIINQDQKRHEANNKHHVCWMEIREKLATISTTLEMMKSTYNSHEAVLNSRSDHDARIESLEKNTQQLFGAIPRNRRSTD